MAAGVHFAWDLGAIGEVGLLFDRQRIHVGAESDRARALSLRAVNDADHAGAADSRLDLVAAEGAKLVGDEPRRLLDIVKEPRVLMDLAPPGPGVGNEVGDRGSDRHREKPSCGSRQVEVGAGALSTGARPSRRASGAP